MFNPAVLDTHLLDCAFPSFRSLLSLYDSVSSLQRLLTLSFRCLPSLLLGLQTTSFSLASPRRLGPGLVFLFHRLSFFALLHFSPDTDKHREKMTLFQCNALVMRFYFFLAQQKKNSLFGNRKFKMMDKQMGEVIYIKSGLYNRKEAEKRDMSSLVATLPISEHHLQP